MSTPLPHCWHESKLQAERVYGSLLKELENARTIYVGGPRVNIDARMQPSGEAEFLCKLYPSLVFVDDGMAGETLFGKNIISTKELAKKASSADFLINCALYYSGFNHFSRQTDSLGIPGCSVAEVLAAHHAKGIVMNFSGLTSVYGPAFHVHTFRHLEKYASLRHHFYDKLSLRTFDNLINYRLTGNQNFLYSIAVGHNYGTLRHDSYLLNAQFFTLSDNEVFIDAGAFDGESSKFFIESVNGKFDRVIMFEPFSESVQKCRATIDAMERIFPGSKDKIEIVEAGLYDRRGSLALSPTLFDQDVTERVGTKPNSAHLIDTGLSDAFVEKDNEYNIIQVPIVTLDECLNDGKDRCTLIKYEIEGSEVAALDGAKKTILNNKPKMALSIYHRPQDLELIIDYVTDLGLGYKMALRAHNPWVPDAIVLYCWI